MGVTNPGYRPDDNAATAFSASIAVGLTPAEATLLAKRSDVVITFGIRVEGEGFDGADLSLPLGQDAVIRCGGGRQSQHHCGAGDR